MGHSSHGNKGNLPNPAVKSTNAGTGHSSRASYTPATSQKPNHTYVPPATVIKPSGK